MAVDMVALAKENPDFAVILYDQFREVGNVLSGYIFDYECKALEANDHDSAEIFHQEYMDLRHELKLVDPDDVDRQAQLMEEWGSIINGLRAA